jgi:hypothetical protein
MTHDDFYTNVFMKFVSQFSEYQDAARELNISKSLMSKMVTGAKPVSHSVAEQLGYQIQKVYVPKGEQS